MYNADHQNEDGVVIGYMDKVDFQHELGAALGGNRIFPSVEDLQKNKPCTQQCGIVEVEVKLRSTVQETDFSEGIRKARKNE